MNMMFRKLRSRRGETLVETLASILVVTLASIVMYSMVTAAADINTTAKRNDQTVQEQLIAAERAEQGDRTGSGKIYMFIEVNGETEEIAEVDVDIFGAEGELFSYFIKEDGTE